MPTDDEKLENMKEDLFNRQSELAKLVKKEISELEEKISKIEILASAKAVIVPEDKAILWTDRIEKLESEIKSLKPFKANDMELLHKARKELSELKENQNHWATLENVTVCRLSIEWLEEVLRDFLNLERKVFLRHEDQEAFGFLTMLMDKLRGENSSSEVNHNPDMIATSEGLEDSKPPSNVDVDVKITPNTFVATFKEKSQRHSLLGGRFDGQFAGSARQTEKSCNNCGYFSYNDCMNIGAIVHADGGVCWKPKEVAEPLDEIANIKQIIQIYDNGHERVFYPDTHIVGEKADLEKMIEEGKKTCNRDKDLWWSNMEEKYLGGKD